MVCEEYIDEDIFETAFDYCSINRNALDHADSDLDG